MLYPEMVQGDPSHLEKDKAHCSHSLPSWGQMLHQVSPFNLLYKRNLRGKISRTSALLGEAIGSLQVGMTFASSLRLRNRGNYS